MFRGNGSKGLVLDIVLVSALMAIGFVIIKKTSYSGNQSEPFYSTSLASNPNLVDQGSDVGLNLVKHFNQLAQDGSAASQKSLSKLQISTNLIEAKIKEIKDARSRVCVGTIYDIKDSVTVIIDFSDYQFYSLKSTISSLLNVNNQRIAEIIIVDDGSTLQYIIDECDKYVTSLGARARLIRQKTQRGQLRSRLAAVAVAKMEMVVFLDTNVICNHGWLEPLIHLLTTEPNTIAVPHFDSIHDPVSMEYRTTPHNLISTWTWNLLVKMKENDDKRATAEFQYIITPTLRGNVWAVRRSFLASVNSLDENFEDGGGEYLDLSLKVWMCARGAIKIATCSHVGILELNTPVKVKTSRNVRHIAETWFGVRKDVVLRLHGLPPSSTMKALWNVIPNIEKCHNIEWYMRNVKNETMSPSTEAVQYGVLKVHTGRCARVSKVHPRIDLEECEADPSKGEPFELTKDGYLHTSDGRCLTTTQNAYIIADTCKFNDTHQNWRYTAEFELVNIWSNYCAQHVSDPDKRGEKDHNQIVMAQQCQVQEKAHLHFKQWTFYSL